MSSRYTSDGRRRSSMTHARRGHECSLCGQVVFGNGGKVSHGRSHVKRGEAVELLKAYASYPPMSTREFFAPDDPIVAKWLNEGFRIVDQA
ncbi:hypothetical protein [Mycolicibacterium sp.]|uniref:hypothetical protein n=1 Tax=Mycolicibacterium sp. TaxID=2320850 RepID=UPI0037CC1620